MKKLFSNISPSRFLMIVNVYCTGISFIQGIATAALIGPALFGVTGLIAGTNQTILYFLEIQLTDLAAKLYYNKNLPDGVDELTYQSSVARLCVLSKGIVSLLIIILGVTVTYFTIHNFTDRPVRLMWIFSGAYLLAMRHWGGAFMFIRRFSEKYYLIGVVKFFAHTVSTIVFFPFILKHRDLNGYYIGGLFSITTLITIQIASTLYIWKKHQNFPIFGGNLMASYPDWAKNLRFLFSANLFGYGKMLHKAADILLVGYFCSDSVTGAYRLVRSLTDRLDVLIDAMSQVYLPRLLRMLSEKKNAHFKKITGGFMAKMAGMTVVIIAMERILLPFVLKLNMGSVSLAGYEDVMSPIIIMTIPFLFLAGVHMWMWPMIITLGRMGVFIGFTAAACVAQYAVSALLFKYVSASPISAACGYVTFYLVLYPGFYLYISKQLPELVPDFLRKRKEKISSDVPGDSDSFIDP